MKRLMLKWAKIVLIFKIYRQVSKKGKNRELSDEEKAVNRELSRRRIVIENINAQIKVFKIMSYPYRNRRRRHLLRTKLVCAVLNAEKAWKWLCNKSNVNGENLTAKDAKKYKGY